MIRGRYIAYAGVSAPDSILGRVGFGIQVLVARREWCAECQDSRMEKDEAAERPATVSIVRPHVQLLRSPGSETKAIWPGSRAVSAAESEPARPCRLLQALRRLSRPLV